MHAYSGVNIYEFNHTYSSVTAHRAVALKYLPALVNMQIHSMSRFPSMIGAVLVTLNQRKLLAMSM